MTRVVVIGSGFAGLWAALGAARRLDELAVPAGTVDVMVVSNKPFHDIRVRNYEADLSACRIPLGDVLGPAGVAHVTAEVTAIDADGRRVTTSTGASYSYDRLVLASGSHVVKPRCQDWQSSVLMSTRTTARSGYSSICKDWPAGR